MAESFIGSAEADVPCPKALIVPHAGYVFSGPIAGRAYALIQRLRGVARRVVLIGPCHRTPVRGIVAPLAGAFRTPLGDVPVDRDGLEAALALEPVSASDTAHAGEHSVEVQLPFLQIVLGEFAIVPLLTGLTEVRDVATVLESLWGGSETLIVVSPDLSHYLPYHEASATDARTAAAIEALDADAMDHHHACGADGVRGLLRIAKQRSLTVRRVDLRSSGDTAGPRDRVVGYGAFAVYESAA
jgi:AmmeMemoRadiSam system protein B